ncbi:MAG: protein kinase [Akkermansiaceae bacterium]|nr:protein kinase [Akkermansiaceae bacterium]
MRDVALKMLKIRNLSARERVCFEIESQTLARMRHPNVAQVLEVGADEQGTPFMAMEFVDGVRIHQYCDQEQLDIRARLALFIDVLKGVQHAHQKA